MQEPMKLTFMGSCPQGLSRGPGLSFYRPLRGRLGAGTPTPDQPQGWAQELWSLGFRQQWPLSLAGQPELRGLAPLKVFSLPAWVPGPVLLWSGVYADSALDC